MKATKKIAALFSAAAVAFGAWAVPNVTITKVQQDYPNSNTVTVNYTVAGGVTDDSYSVKFYSTIDGTVEEVTVTGEDLLATGDHEVTWTAPANKLDKQAGFSAKVIAKGETPAIATVAELQEYADEKFATKEEAAEAYAPKSVVDTVTTLSTTMGFSTITL